MPPASPSTTNPRVRPISGLILVLVGIFMAVLFFKGYTFRQYPLRLLHLLIWTLAFAWGLKTSIWGGRRREWRSLERWMPYRIEVTSEGWLYFLMMLTVLVGAMVGQSNLLLLVFGLLCGPFVLNGYLALNVLLRNQVARHLPERAMQGEWFSVDVAVSNRRWWLSSWMLVVEDRVEGGGGVLKPTVLFSRIGPGSERISRYQLRLMQRGKYNFGPVRLFTRFPLGLVERSFTTAVPGSILVHPRIGRLTPAWHQEVLRADELVEQPRTRPGAHDDEFHRLREYRPGDSLRAVHWRTTARRNTLMVREYHESRDLDLALMLDLASLEDDTTSFQAVEAVVQFTAILLVEHCRKSRESMVWLGIAGKQTHLWEGAAGPQAIPFLLDQLALCEGAPNPDLEWLWNRSGELRRPQVRRFLLTTRDLKAALPRQLKNPPHQGSARIIPPRILSGFSGGLERYCEFERDKPEVEGFTSGTTERVL